MWRTPWRSCLLAMLLGGCATSGVNPEGATPQVKTRIIDTGCDWTRPILVNGADVLSDATARQILAHNEAGAKHCGWRPATKSSGV
jgi:hypothetical protein